MFIILVARKFSGKYHHWCYGTYSSVDEAMTAARNAKMVDFIVLPVIDRRAAEL